MREPGSRPERMRADADVAEGRRYVGDPGEGLRQHVEGVSRASDIDADQLSPQTIDQTLLKLASAAAPGPLRQALSGYRDVLRISRMVAEAFHDEPGVVQGMLDIQAEILRSVTYGSES